MAETRHRTRLLLAASDPGGAGHLAQIGRAALDRAGLETFCVAEAPAFDAFRAAGLPVERIDVGAARSLDDLEAANMLATADALALRFVPDVTLVGLSGPGTGGISEALLATPEAGRRVAFQDFWGDVNDFFGAVAERYLVLDSVAAAMTRTRVEASTSIIAVGAPKSAQFVGVDVAAMRREARLRWRASGPVLVMFGQPLWQFDGYARTLVEMATAAANSDGDWTLIYRPHPREREADVERAQALLSRAPGLRSWSSSVKLDRHPDLLAALTGADAGVSVFSTTALDAALLERVTGVSIAPHLAALWEPDLWGEFQSSSSLPSLPLADLGLVEHGRTSDAARTFLKSALAGDALRRVSMARAALPDPRDAPERALNAALSVASSGKPRLCRH